MFIPDNSSNSGTTGASFNDTLFSIFDALDTTIRLRFNVTGSTGTTLTIKTNQTVNTIVNVPDTAGVTDTILLAVLAQTVSNKAIDNSNVISVKENNFDIQDQVDSLARITFQITHGAGLGLSIRSTQATFSGLADIPDLGGSTDTFLFAALSQAFSNKTIGNTNVASLRDDRFTLQDNGDTTKQMVFQLSAITTATTRTVTMPDANVDLSVGSTLTTKGDILTRSTTAYVRRSIGADGLALLADSADPSGMNWGTPISAPGSNTVTPAMLTALSSPINFNWTFNSDFEIWGSGTALAPTGWTLAGSGATIAKNTTAGQFKYGSASVAVTRVGNDATLYQDIDLIPGFGPAAAWGSKVVVLGMWVRATVASRARIYIDDGTTTTYSSYHTGGSSFEFLTVTVTLQATPTRVRVGCSVDTGNTTAQFDAGVFTTGEKIANYIPSGWRGRKCVIEVSSGNTVMAAVGDFFGHAFGAAATDERYVLSGMPYKGVARNMIYRIADVAGAAKSYSSALRKNGATTALTATISGAAALTSSDLTNEVAYAQGDSYCGIHSATTGAVSGTYHTLTFEYEEIP